MKKRARVLGSLVVLGAITIAASAQAPAAPDPKAIAAMQVVKVKDNLFMITGSAPDGPFAGGNTAVFVGSTGVTLVDTKLAGFGPALLERIRTVTDKPIVRIINTHAHADHTGGNLAFGTVETIVHENANATMLNARNKAPRRTYQDRQTIGTGADQIDLYYFGRGHTDGDTFVVFPALRTMHVGDMFAWKALPYIDNTIGGSIVEHPKTIAAAVAGAKNVDTIINGHIPVSTLNDLREYGEFVQDFVGYAERSLKAGKPVEQAAKEYRVPARFKGYTEAVMPDVGAAANLKIAYGELQKR